MVPLVTGSLRGRGRQLLRHQNQLCRVLRRLRLRTAPEPRDKLAFRIRNPLYFWAMDSETLARELAERMKAVVPSGIRISVEGNMLEFRSDFNTGGSGSYACQWLDGGTGTPSERIREACWRAFSDLQDFVDEETTEPWPGLKTPPHPHARIENDFVIIWFGDSQAPDLIMAPLPLDER